MQRIVEPELMEDVEQVIAYAEADFEQPHNDFVQRIATKVNQPDFNGTALDLGCGPGDISRRFLRQFPNCEIDAVDGSKPMIDYALKLNEDIHKGRLRFLQGKLPTAILKTGGYDIIFSNSLLHHLPDPSVLWQTVKAYAKCGTQVYIMDLLRPDSIEQAARLVASYAKNEPEILKRDFYSSLLAAFTIDEIKQQLLDAEINLTIEQPSDRHVFIYGTLT